MKLHNFDRPTAANPLQGVTFHAADKVRIQRAADALVGLSFETLMVIRTALGQEILRLEAAWAWTTEGSEAETERQEQFLEAVIAYQAADDARVQGAVAKAIAKARD